MRTDRCKKRGGDGDCERKVRRERMNEREKGEERGRKYYLFLSRGTIPSSPRGPTRTLVTAEERKREKKRKEKEKTRNNFFFSNTCWDICGGGREGVERGWGGGGEGMGRGWGGDGEKKKTYPI